MSKNVKNAPRTTIRKSETGERWEVIFDDEFRCAEWKSMDVEQRKALVAAADSLAKLGPRGGRPLIGTLINPVHPNMKELRFVAHNGTEVWRAAFAFDPVRKAVILFAGDKQGQDEQQFYRDLLRKANTRYGMHLMRLSVEPSNLRKPSSLPGSSVDNRIRRRSR